MNLEKQESREEERRLEDKKMKDASELLEKEDGKSKSEIADIAGKAGKNAYDEILSTRLGSERSDGKTEKAEFEEKAAPYLVEYQKSVEAAQTIEDPETRKKALETAYAKLTDELEGVRGTQEGRDAENDKKRREGEKKTAEDTERERGLKFSEAILKAAKEIEIDRRLSKIKHDAEKRARLSETANREALDTARKAVGELERNMMA